MSDRTKYNLLLRVTHWVVGVLIISMLIMGFYMVNLSSGDINKFEIYKFHKQIGLLIFIFVLFRIMVRFMSYIPAYSRNISYKFVVLSKIIHFFLYLIMISMAISGYVMSAASGRSIAFFSIDVPLLISRSQIIAAMANNLHFIFAITLIVLITLHVLGTIWHIIIDKENIIKRIF